MREISLHILDVAENGITAGASCIHIVVEEARAENVLKIVIRDNGRGISSEKIDRIADPFVTTRTTRRVGLGLSLLEAAARRCDGEAKIESEPGAGTEVTAVFRYDHIDRALIGDMAGSITTLIVGNPDVDFVYDHSVDDRHFGMDTREIRKELEDSFLTDPAVIYHLAQTIRKHLNRLDQGQMNSEMGEEGNGKIDDRRS
ncbi:MAG TPA: ATP-binding protein [Desulfobacterales bacterium]|nr:ATP-binding protein [Desulfobacterales bacterium]